MKKRWREAYCLNWRAPGRCVTLRHSQLVEMSTGMVVFTFFVVVTLISTASSAVEIENDHSSAQSSNSGRQLLSNAVTVLGLAKKLLRWVGDSRSIDVEWIVQKFSLVQLYVSAGSTFAERLDADLVDALLFGKSGGGESERGRSVNDYSSTWRYRPPIPSFVRKSKTKLKDFGSDDLSSSGSIDDDDQDLLGSYGHSSHSSYGGGGYDDGYGGKNKTS